MTPMSATLELRVLSGLHRDARCKARHGHLLGADPDCDIVLADEGLPSRSARLILGDTAWGLAAGDDDPGPADAADTPYNQPMPLGPIWLTVARPEDPWPTLPESSPAGIATDSSDSGDTPPAADAPATAAPESPAEHPESTTADSVRSRQTPATGDQAARSRPGRRWIALLGLTLAIMAVMVALALASQRTPPPTTPTRPDPRVAAEQSIPRIQSALDTLGLSSRLRVSLAPGGTTALVSGWVRDAAERDALSAALAQIWPMPAMQISIEAEAVRLAETILQGYSVKYAPRYDGEGRLSILGIAADEAESTAAIDAVRSQLPGMVVMGNAILLAPAVADTLSHELSAAGLSGVTLSWERHRLRTDASELDGAQRETFERILADFNRRFFDVVALPDQEGTTASTVPFGILSVVGGDTPFIVLEDGQKLLVGGTYRNYRLISIEDNQLTFDGPRPAIVLR